MAVPRRQPALKVEIPKDESPRFARVGVIAVIGFGVGALWPTVVGFKLVPNVPGQATPAPGLGGEPVAALSAPAASASAEPPEVEAPAPATKARGPVVGELQVTSCKDRKQKRQEPCDSIAFDRVARARLALLAECEGVERMNGVLSLGFELDFPSGQIERVASGKSTTLRQAESDSVVECAKKQFAGVELAGIDHQHEKYTLFYRVEFQAAGGDDDAATDEAVSVTPASGKATVSWDVALVRSAPSKDGKVVARILSGTRVIVTGRNGEWYEIKYDAKGNQGWVYRTAIGM